MVDDNNNLAEEYVQPTVAMGFIIFFNNGVLDNNETMQAILVVKLTAIIPSMRSSTKYNNKIILLLKWY